MEPESLLNRIRREVGLPPIGPGVGAALPYTYPVDRRPEQSSAYDYGLGSARFGAPSTPAIIGELNRQAVETPNFRMPLQGALRPRPLLQPSDLLGSPTVY